MFILIDVISRKATRASRPQDETPGMVEGAGRKGRYPRSIKSFVPDAIPRRAAKEGSRREAGNLLFKDHGKASNIISIVAFWGQEISTRPRMI